MRIPKYRPPSHPGEILLKDFPEPLEISLTELAQAMHLPRKNKLLDDLSYEKFRRSHFIITSYSTGYQRSTSILAKSAFDKTGVLKDPRLL
ncbi:hypothetical protein [Nostoc sp. FACHB-190]|uniref:hypothetical protein n=1 Tax=Nostoc sp. FACHB-190 TaxID=2692838 RepID=UPI001685A714|nr:hypothetical protein [Nostoc sp. FACHB-190]MBD2297666.1 hypothetical protein [Nostoc sp. FACHB-190]